MKFFVHCKKVQKNSGEIWRKNSSKYIAQKGNFCVSLEIEKGLVILWKNFKTSYLTNK